MTFVTFFVPAIALLLLPYCLLVSLQVGIAARTLYLIWAAQTLSRAGYSDYEIWQKSDTTGYLNCSTWFVGVASWLGSLWIMVTLVGLLLRTDVMLTLAGTLAPGADGSSAWQVMMFLVLVTSLMTNDYAMRPVRQHVRNNKPDSLQTI